MKRLLKSTRRRALLVAGLGAAVLGKVPVGARAQSGPVIRIAVIGSSGQAELTTAIQQHGLDRKHGLELQVVDYAAPGQQYTLFRAGSADVAIGNFVDLHRQRRAGVAIKAFHGYQAYSNSVVVRPSSTITKFSDLRGRRVGGFGNTFLDWLVLRAAGKKAHGLDIEIDANSIVAAPPLLNQFVARGEIDAAIQFSSLSIGPLTLGEQRAITDLPTLMREAGLSPDCFYTQWFIAEDWVRRFPGNLDRVYAMFAEGYGRLASDDAIWTGLAQKIRITDPKVVAAYRDKARKINNPPYRKELLQPTQTLLTEIVTVAGEQSTGFARLDPEAFIFPGR